MKHGDHVSENPPGFEVPVGTSPGALYAITRGLGRQFYAGPVPPEVHAHAQRQDALREFRPSRRLSRADWDDPRLREEAIRAIANRLGLMPRLSAACRAGRQLGRRGPDPRGDRRSADLRLRRSRAVAADEAEEVVKMFRDHYNIPRIHADESEAVPRCARGRFAIRKQSARPSANCSSTFFQKYADGIEGGRVPPRPGTLYPDVIESVSFSGAAPRSRIKSHHNVGGPPEKMGLKLVKPLRELFKDEVRGAGS